MQQLIFYYNLIFLAIEMIRVVQVLPELKNTKIVKKNFHFKKK
jgi:hypothetical protein